MAAKRFHIAPGGPERCAVSRGCFYDTHYANIEVALADEATMHSNAEFLEEIRRLHKVVNGRQSESNGSFRFKGVGARDLGDHLDDRLKRLGEAPEVIRGVWGVWLNNGSFQTVDLTIARSVKVDEDYGELVGVWDATIKATSIAYIDADKPYTMKLKFGKGEAIHDSDFEPLIGLFSKALEMSGVRDDERIQEQSLLMLEDFKAMFDSLEGESGDYNLWNRERGYFLGSYAGSIEVDVSYLNTSFRGENFRRFIRDNPYYAQFTPDVNIRVYESSTANASSWSINRRGGQWVVDKTYHDGTHENVIAENEQEVFDLVYWQVMNQTHPGDAAAAHSRGNYAADLMIDVEKALVEHGVEAAASIDLEHRANEARKSGGHANDVYYADRLIRGREVARIRQLSSQEWKNWVHFNGNRRLAKRSLNPFGGRSSK